MSVLTQEALLPRLTDGRGWLNWMKRLGLRWVMLYFILYIFLDQPLEAIAGIPGLQFLSWIAHDPLRGNAPTLPTILWNAVVPWVGQHILGRPIPLYPVGRDGGEPLFNYVRDGIIVVLGFVGAIVWAFLDRETAREQKLYAAMRILLRYTLGFVLLFEYGLPKLFPCGFFWCVGTQPGLLMQPLGDLLPHSLMWMFFGYSYPYSFLIGVAETAGGALLFFRRTTTLGSLILVAVLANVAILDTLFNVEVKLFSTNLTLMALFLLAPEMQRISNVMFGFPTSGLPTYSRTKAWSVASGIVKILIIGLILYQLPMLGQATKAVEVAAAQSLPMAGYYQVDDFQRNGQNKFSVQDKSVWRMISIDRNDYRDDLHARTTSGSVKEYLLQIRQVDSRHGLFYLTRCADIDFDCAYMTYRKFTPKTDSASAILRYVVLRDSLQPGEMVSPGNEVLALTGNIDGAKVSMRVHRLVQSPFRLERSRFHLVDPADPEEYLWF